MRKVSIIIPTCNRYDCVIENIENILNQDYKNIEILICDDSDITYLNNHKDLLQKLQGMPKVLYFYTAQYDHEGKKIYGIAGARNTGIIEATSEVLIFLDDRITPDRLDMINVFEEKLNLHKKGKVWLFGDKGAHKTSFVENCSCILRQHIIDAGMFCERINKYGGMTRELISRFAKQGFKLLYTPDALAKPITKSRDRERKEKEMVEARTLLKKINVI